MTQRVYAWMSSRKSCPCSLSTTHAYASPSGQAAAVANGNGHAATPERDAPAIPQQNVVFKSPGKLDALVEHVYTAMDKQVRQNYLAPLSCRVSAQESAAHMACFL